MEALAVAVKLELASRGEMAGGRFLEGLSLTGTGVFRAPGEIYKGGRPPYRETGRLLQRVYSEAGRESHPSLPD